MKDQLWRNDYHPCKGEVSKMIVEMDLNEQLLLPFEIARQSNIHQFARRFGLKVKTQTIIMGGVKNLRVRRVA